ncbi:MAG TPA: hypothetical protein VII11_11040 [Bacteroidota bacterium]
MGKLRRYRNASLDEASVRAELELPDEIPLTHASFKNYYLPDLTARALKVVRYGLKRRSKPMARFVLDLRYGLRPGRKRPWRPRVASRLRSP